MLKRMAKDVYQSWPKTALLQRIQDLEQAALKAGLEVPATNDNHVVQHSTGPDTKTAKKAKTMDFSKFSTRKVAIRFAYMGWNYHGLAFQKDEKAPTIELHILNALAKTRCIPSSDPTDCDFSRCGRTDRDVSAMGQVISLKVRSLLNPDEQQDPANDSRELDYLKMLNSHLPHDILAYEICLRPPKDFDARFSCTYRHYRYYFYKAKLDIAKMRAAAELFLGQHDFRNFCRVDASKQISNFERRVLISEIVQENDELYYFSLRGTAFLWNQVRSMMAMLFLVGQGHEPQSTISRLLDVHLTPNRPAYEIAWGVPLVLYECGYEKMEWLNSRYTRTENVFNLWHESWTKATIAKEMISVVSPHAVPDERVSQNNGHGIGKVGKYVSVLERPRLETPDVKNQRWLEKKSQAKKL